jgi:membrane-associated phospholipid phosphatase
MMSLLNKGNFLGVLKRFSLWISLHGPVVRLFLLTVGLIVYFVFLPPYIRNYFYTGLQSHKILASMLIVFNTLAVSLVWSTGQKVDSWTFLVFNLRGTRPVWLDLMMSGFTQLGSGFAALGIVAVFFLVGNHVYSYELILASVTLWMVVELLKFLVHRSRPFIRLTQTRIIGGRAIGQSFPSGHTSQAFLLATLTAQHFALNIWIVFLLYAIALLVGITRMYVGAHYPRDVVAGAILGSAWGLLGVIVEGTFRNGVG